MTIGTSLALIAVGAILKWAVTVHASWIDIQTVGIVLFIVGLAGLPLALLYTFWWSERGVDDRAMMRPPAPPRY